MRKRHSAEINTGAMADIAFLLLIFFLVATEINQDKAVSVILPKYHEFTTPGPISKRNLLKIKINEDNEILLNGEIIALNKVKLLVMDFVENPQKSMLKPREPENAVISLMNDIRTSYEDYVQLYAQIKLAYQTLRNDYSNQQFGKSFNALSQDKKKIVASKYKIKISEAEYSIAQK